METGLEVAVNIPGLGLERSEQLLADHAGVAVVRSDPDPRLDVYQQAGSGIGLQEIDLVGPDVLERGSEGP